MTTQALDQGGRGGGRVRRPRAARRRAARRAASAARCSGGSSTGPPTRTRRPRRARPSGERARPSRSRPSDELKPSTVHDVRLVAQQSGTRKATRWSPSRPRTHRLPLPHPLIRHHRPALARPARSARCRLGARARETVVAAPAGGEVRVRLPGADGSWRSGSPAPSRSGPSSTRPRAACGSTPTREAARSAGRSAAAASCCASAPTGTSTCISGAAGSIGAGHRSLAATAAGKRKRGRKLRGRDRGGRFRTHGRDSVATVRGTRWSMTDRCGGTLTEVSEGAVDVRVRRTGKIVRVPAGDRHFAPHRVGRAEPGRTSARSAGSHGARRRRRRDRGGAGRRRDGRPRRP